MKTPRRQKHILVIKHGALGDVFQAFSAFDAIRAAYPHGRLSVLTSTPYAPLLRASPWFETVIIDDRAPLSNWREAKRLWLTLRKFNHIIDLQNSGRTRLYAKMLWHSSWASLDHLGPKASCKKLHHAREMHGMYRQEIFLKALGINPVKRQIPHWLSPHGPVLPKPYIVIVPGASMHRPAKCWPINNFISLASYFEKLNYQCVIVGGEDNITLGQVLEERCQDFLKRPLINLIGKTTLFELAGLISRAALVIGNDTGALHVAATMDRPNLTLFSKESDPRRCSPLAITPDYSQVMAVSDLSFLTVQRVIAFLNEWFIERISQKN
ncbi:glycosyltransferase family 9 protein [Aristophania vespae]|uniref:glycosyltransferase family 9 protein n=1 Tax=Aristophania vespae TaxID=2697033 RepID=UPI00235133E4|nr:glycosyltransferase family 9 protein [Aristophania vespae]UMM64273.1 Lipopolysaccharide heptosyltransferase 1 [Aristophania vespae]